jgi:hypothetical protein
METHKVKYTRKEYREEYLNSEEWKTLRDSIMAVKPTCQCKGCDKPAADLHHMVYRNIVDVKITDLIPVCRSCHDLIHQSIKDKWISQKINDLEIIKDRTLNIHDGKYKNYHEWIISKHYLSDDEIKTISLLPPFVIKKISALFKKHLWYDKLNDVKFTGRQILEIRKIIALAEQRQKRDSDPLIKQQIERERKARKTEAVIRSDSERKESWLNSKHLLSEEDKKEILSSKEGVMLRVKRFSKKNIWYDDLDNVELTGRQILEIRKVIQFIKYRKLKEHKIGRNSKYIR